MSTPNGWRVAPEKLLIPKLDPGPVGVELIAPAPCTAACPAGVNVKAYVSLIAEGRFAEALAEVRRRCPLPSVCGRVCHHPCEPACERSAIDEPVAIRALKRFAADPPITAPLPEPAPAKDEAVAVIGSGPAGLTAAYDLCLAGYPVEVFEAMPQPGGMLRYGIADYRLPPEVLDAEIDVLRQVGMTITTGTPIESVADVDRLRAQFAAVLVAVGSQRGRLLGIPGEDEATGVRDALGFLRRVNEGDRTPLDGRVVVVGGGSTAVEAARAALRLGAEAVEIVYRRSPSEMPASAEEVEAAEFEGVTFRFQAAPRRVVTDDGLVGLECVAVLLGEPDAGGRPRPVPQPGTEFLVPASHILAAVGQVAELDFLPAGELIAGGRIVAAADTLATPWDGVFAAGDVVTGPATVIEAIAAGHQAAAAIAAYLETGSPAPAPAPPAATEYGFADPPPRPRPGTQLELVAPAPGREFAEVEQPLSPDAAMAEAGRCLRCGPCAECAACAPGCERRHLFLRPAAADTAEAPLVVRAGPDHHFRPAATGPLLGTLNPDGDARAGRAVAMLPLRVDYFENRCRGCTRCIEVCAFGALSIEGPVAVLDADRCRGCALCTAVCPTHALVSPAYSPQWWDAVGRAIEADPPRRVMVACEIGVEAADEDAMVIPVRCAGQVHPGTLVELRRRGAQEITLSHCGGDGCRFGAGAQLADRNAADARSLLSVMGAAATVTAQTRPDAGAARPDSTPLSAAKAGVSRGAQ